MSSTIQTVPFHGLSLSAVMVNGAPFVAIRPICEALGINEAGQRQRINRDPALKSVACVMHSTGTDGKRYRMLCLPLDRLNGWLFGVDVARVREELRERLNWYRRECFEVLARHFGLSRGDGLDDLRRQLREAEADEAASHAAASMGSHAMNRRRREKTRLLGKIETLRESVQLALPLALEGGAA